MDIFVDKLPSLHRRMQGWNVEMQKNALEIAHYEARLAQMRERNGNLQERYDRAETVFKTLAEKGLAVPGMVDTIHDLLDVRTISVAEGEVIETLESLKMSGSPPPSTHSTPPMAKKQRVELPQTNHADEPTQTNPFHHTTGPAPPAQSVLKTWGVTALKLLYGGFIDFEDPVRRGNLPLALADDPALFRLRNVIPKVIKNWYIFVYGKTESDKLKRFILASPDGVFFARKDKWAEAVNRYLA